MPVDINNNGMTLPAFNIREEEDRMPVRSMAVQEIISRRPDFISRWSLIIFLGVLLLLGSGTWFVKYPDTIQAVATLTAANAPKEIVARQEGKIIKIFAVNDEKVLSGKMIAWLESTANHQEMIDLSGLLDRALYFLSADLTEKVSNSLRHEFHDLGEIQSSYQQFVRSLEQFNDYLVNGYYYKRKIRLHDNYSYLKKIHESLDLQKKLNEHNLDLIRESYSANDSLYKDKVISREDLRDKESKLTDRQLGIPQIEENILINESQQIDKQKEINELEHSISQQKLIFRQELQTLKSSVDEWMKKYIIRAPIEGKVVFIVPLQENQFIQSEKVIGFINPSDSRYYAQVNLPQINFGKIRTGQKVQLRFDAYPYQEFGFVEGNLSYISKIPSDSGFLATIELPKGLVTSYKKEIQYRSGLKSQALIITKDTRLLQKFYYNLIKGTQK